MRVIKRLVIVVTIAVMLSPLLPVLLFAGESEPTLRCLPCGSKMLLFPAGKDRFYAHT